MKNIVFCILFLATNFSLHSQDQSKLGMIVFKSCKYITNKHLAPSASEKAKINAKLKKFVKKNIDSINPDAFIGSIPKTEIQIYGDSLKCTYVLDIYKEVYESKASCAYLEKSTTEMYEQIHRETLKANTIKRNIETNTYKILSKRQIKLSSILKSYDLIEYRNDTKMILGYTCFKIVLKKKNVRNPHLTVFDIEMYVTEDIKLNYNPVSRYEDILNKYYPLEIIKKPQKEVMTEVTAWKAIQIDLKDL